MPGAAIYIAPQGQPTAPAIRTPITLGCSEAFRGQTKHGGGDYAQAHRRPHVYAHVEDLRYLPISRADSLWAILAMHNGPQNESSIGKPFGPEYLAVLRIRAMGHLEVYEFDDASAAK